MTLYKWSQTASSDATADATINWAEGQSPSSVNDSARAMMAATAKYRDDIAGAIVTSGTSTAYAVSSYQVFDTLAHLGGQVIAFTPHVTNAATVTLNVDSLGAKPLRTSPNTELLAGTIIHGTPYVATYNNSDGAFYLQGFYANPYNVPLGAGMDYWGIGAPNSSFAVANGQAISRTTYAALFALFGSAYGLGDGSTTFNIPDKTGRVSAMLEASATRLTTAGSGVNGGVIGASGGGESHTLTLGELPTGITSSGSNTITVSPNGSSSNFVPFNNDGWVGVATGTGGNIMPFSNSDNLVQSTGTFSGSQTINVTSTNTGGNAHRTVQPTIVCNYIIRII
jgi:microcystin-dependent protein